MTRVTIVSPIFESKLFSFYRHYPRAHLFIRGHASMGHLDCPAKHLEVFIFLNIYLIESVFLRPLAQMVAIKAQFYPF